VNLFRKNKSLLLSGDYEFSDGEKKRKRDSMTFSSKSIQEYIVERCFSLERRLSLFE